MNQENGIFLVLVEIGYWIPGKSWNRKILQINEYETALNFIQLNQNLISDCLFI